MDKYILIWCPLCGSKAIPGMRPFYAGSRGRKQWVMWINTTEDLPSGARIFVRSDWIGEIKEVRAGYGYRSFSAPPVHPVRMGWVYFDIPDPLPKGSLVEVYASSPGPVYLAGRLLPQEGDSAPLPSPL